MGSINLETMNPDFIYIILIVSLQIGVTAAYVPGTGIMEVIASIGVIGSLAILVSMPTNWLAVLLIVIGVALFLIMPFIKQDYTVVTIFGLGLQGSGSLFLFHGGESVSPFVVVLMLLLSLAYHQSVLLPMFRRIKEQPVTARDDFLVGMRGRATNDINPVGTARVNSEPWTVTSEEPIEAGDEIIVVGRNGLQLVVEKIKRKRTSEDEDTESKENN